MINYPLSAAYTSTSHSTIIVIGYTQQPAKMTTYSGVAQENSNSSTMTLALQPLPQEEFEIHLEIQSSRYIKTTLLLLSPLLALPPILEGTSPMVPPRNYLLLVTPCYYYHLLSTYAARHSGHSTRSLGFSTA